MSWYGSTSRSAALPSKQRQRRRWQMAILRKLDLMGKTKGDMLTSLEARVRPRNLVAIETQIEAAAATLNGETFIRWIVRSS